MSAVRCATEAGDGEVVAKGRLVEPSGRAVAPAPAARLRGVLCNGFDMVEAGVVSIGMSDFGGATCGRDAICRT
jgi:hypothetical protein